MKNRAYQDDLSDSLRYVTALVPWDFSLITPGEGPIEEEVRDEIPKAEWSAEEYVAWEIRQRRGAITKGAQDGWQDFEDTVEEWNAAYGC